ncbi:hypothetical protein ACFC1R_27085 [Kitasatospora sp. NPDC056138]|uniref:hypothetical protein n=1 Tax=Kitasatospora sp. NPDC056138 TaxID=3345724 RepID=UPI0035DA9A74
MSDLPTAPFVEGGQAARAGARNRTADRKAEQALQRGDAVQPLGTNRLPPAVLGLIDPVQQEGTGAQD